MHKFSKYFTMGTILFVKFLYLPIHNIHLSYFAARVATRSSLHVSLRSYVACAHLKYREVYCWHIYKYILRKGPSSIENFNIVLLLFLAVMLHLLQFLHLHWFRQLGLVLLQFHYLYLLYLGSLL